MAAPENEPLLTSTQRRLLGFSLGLFGLVASAVLIIFIVILFGRLVGFFADVLWPLAVAGIIALVMRPIVDQLESGLRGKRIAAVIVLYGIFLLIVSGLLISIVPPVAQQILDFIAYLPDVWTRAVTYTKEHSPGWIALVDRLLANPAVNSVLDAMKAQAEKVPAMIVPSLKAVGGGFFAFIGLFTHVAIIPIYLFFFLLSNRDPVQRLPEHLSFLKLSIRHDVVFLVREFISIVVSFFRGQLLIGLIMGVILATGFTIIGLKFGLIIGLALGLLNIVPYLGTIIGLIVTLPLAFFQPEGGFRLVGLVLLVKIIAQCVEGWVLTPKIMGDRTGLHPVTIIVAIFFWGTAFDGILGMILAIPLTAFFVTTWRLVKRKYLTVDGKLKPAQ